MKSIYKRYIPTSHLIKLKYILELINTPFQLSTIKVKNEILNATLNKKQETRKEKTHFNC